MPTNPRPLCTRCLRKTAPLRCWESRPGESSTVIAFEWYVWELPAASNLFTEQNYCAYKSSAISVRTETLFSTWPENLKQLHISLFFFIFLLRLALSAGCLLSVVVVAALFFKRSGNARGSQSPGNVCARRLLPCAAACIAWHWCLQALHSQVCVCGEELRYQTVVVVVIKVNWACAFHERCAGRSAAANPDKTWQLISSDC